MFIDVADLRSLRQGDILANIPFPQLITLKTAFLSTASIEKIGPLTFSPSVETSRNAPMYTCQVQARIGFAAVISQCCDLEPREGNRITQPTIAVVRLVTIPDKIFKDSAALSALRDNSDPRIPGTRFLNLFHIPVHARIDNREWMVDFGQVFSIPSSEFPAILDRKVLQMDDDTRIRFKIRLTASFARFTEEEFALHHPWLEQRSGAASTDATPETLPPDAA
jgi:hypothetical protein